MSKVYYCKEIYPDDCELLNENYIKAYMKEHGILELEVNVAKRETNFPYFYCKLYMEVGKIGESCGKICYKYIPNNGKNGRCKYYGYVYEITDEKKTIKL